MPTCRALVRFAVGTTDTPAGQYRRQARVARCRLSSEPPKSCATAARRSSGASRAAAPPGKGPLCCSPNRSAPPSTRPPPFVTALRSWPFKKWASRLVRSEKSAIAPTWLSFGAPTRLNSHPRHFERYSVDATGLFVPRGRADRHVIVIDSEATATSRLADTFVKVPRDADFEVIWAIRQLLRGIDLPSSFDVGRFASELQRLADLDGQLPLRRRLLRLGSAQSGIGHKNVEALLRLVEDLNGYTRFTARRLRIPGDVAGADAVLCWLTGFPFAVNLSRGYPRYNPGEYSANELLELGEVDACLLVGSEAFRDLSPRAQRAIEQIPTIALDYPNWRPPFEGRSKSRRRSTEFMLQELRIAWMRCQFRCVH